MQTPKTQSRPFSRPKKIVMLLTILMIAASCRKDTIHVLAAEATAPETHASPQILALYEPWFGDLKHIDVGYSSQDPAVLRGQIESARRAGISAFLVDWYGVRRGPFLDNSFRLLQKAAHQSHFKVALMYDEAEDDSVNSTDDALESLSRAYKDYIGPEAPYHDTYLTYKGRPVVVIFPKRGKTNWNLLRERVNSWSSPPVLFYKDEAPDAFAGAFDGYYAWVHPGSAGWKADGSDWGEQYLETFYTNMTKKHPDKLAMGAAWPGFNDTRATWGLNRHMATRCGQTFRDTMSLYHRYYDDSAPLSFLLIETWNDYEEGTAMERADFAGCPSTSSNR